LTEGHINRSGSPRQLSLVDSPGALTHSATLAGQSKTVTLLAQRRFRGLLQSMSPAFVPVFRSFAAWGWSGDARARRAALMEESINGGGLSRQLPEAVKRYVWGARVGDFAILAAIPLLGFAYGIQSITPTNVFTAVEIAVASLLLLVHIFALNDWADYDADLRVHPLGNPVRASRDSLLLVSAIALGCCIVVLWSIWPPALVPAAFAIIASAIYSLQWPMRGKEVLVLSSALHAVCGAACFLVGLSAAADLSTRGSSVWVFLGLSMAAGHMHQEISDHREDLASGARTHATVLGPHKAFFLGQLTFAAAFLTLVVLPGGGGSGLFLLLTVLAWAANVALAIACWRDGLTAESVERYRSNYRWLYVLIGLGLLLRTPAVQQLVNF
jgi:4-hydroxybenzoate polyprenyltransferase